MISLNIQNQWLLLILAFLLSLGTLKAQEKPAQSAEELAKKLSNQIASLISVPFQNNTLVGDGLCIGYDSGDPVSKLYTSSTSEFEGGDIAFVTVSTGKEKYSDLEMEAARALKKE